MSTTERKYFGDDQADSASRRQDLERIRFQSEMGFNARTDAFLEGLHLSSSMTFLDLGCGGGEAWPILLKHAGQIIAVDSDGKRLQAGREIIEAYGLEGRVLSTEGNLLHLDVGDGSVDGVYARLVLQHLDDQTRQLAMGEITRALKPGGVAVLEDLIIFGPWKVAPPCGALERLLTAFEATYRKRGTEPDMGLKLPELVNQAGLEVSIYEPYQILSLGNDPFKQAHLNILETAGRGIVAMEVMEPEAFQRDLAEFRKHLLDPRTAAISPTMVQLAAYKKS